MLEQFIDEPGVAVDEAVGVAEASPVVSGTADAVRSEVELLLQEGLAIGDRVRDRKFNWSGIVKSAEMKYGQVWVGVKATDPTAGGFFFSTAASGLEKL